MDEYRSKSYGDGRMEIETYYTNNNNYGFNTNVHHNNNNNNNGKNGFEDLRSYSASYAAAAAADPRELKKGSKSKSSGAWCFSDPELQRKKRVASYKSFSVETSVKRSFSKSFRWIKDRYTNLVHG